MQWAARRQVLFGVAALVIVAVIASVTFFSVWYRAPSCTNGVMDGKETGPDCGGMCTKICLDQAPHVTVLWARALKVTDGVYHAVALIKNPDTTVRGTLPYTVSLYDSSNILIKKLEGTITLAPGEVAPLFEANVPTGSRLPARVFVEFGIGVWAKASRPTVAVVIKNQTPTFAAPEPSLAARVVNDTTNAISDVLVTAFLYDASGTIIAASQTKTGPLAPHADRAIVFTWPVPFAVLPATFDLFPQVQ